MNVILIVLFSTILFSSILFLFKDELKNIFKSKQKSNHVPEDPDSNDDLFEMPSDSEIKDLERQAISILKYRGLSASDEGDALIAMRDLGSKNFSPVTYVKMIKKLVQQNKK